MEPPSPGIAGAWHGRGAALRARLRRFGHRLGIDIRRYAPHSSAAARRGKILFHHRVDVVLDIGANVGQYALDLRAAGFKGRIFSFEPLTEPFEALSRESDGDPQWRCLQLALGNGESRTTMNVAANRAASSSLLPMKSWIAKAAPEQAYIGTEVVQVARLDDAAPPLVGEKDRLMLKLDVQGYELEALRGGESTLRRAEIVEMELSLIRLYENQPLWRDAIDYLHDAGFELISLDPIVHDKEGRLLQMDGIFGRSRRRNSLDV